MNVFFYCFNCSPSCVYIVHLSCAACQSPSVFQNLSYVIYDVPFDVPEFQRIWTWRYTAWAPEQLLAQLISIQSTWDGNSEFSC